VKHPRAHVPRKHAYERTVVGRGATVGANATIICGVAIGAYAMIGAAAAVTRDVPAHGLMIGAPARRIGWACRCGETLAPGACARCTCGDAYELTELTALLLARDAPARG
jgi:UDP-2-acetamido-3-amino-2,3-dideoxy-glucuronate N-acetyltransferase